jgi:mannonate dehydratase
MKAGRRDFLQISSFAGLAALATPVGSYAQGGEARAIRGMSSPRIKDITVIETEPARRLEVVKIVTDQDGLYGYGDATAGYRDELVKPAVEKYLKPLLLGQTTDRIEDIWHQCYYSSYYKNDTVLNSAIGGVDQALWDIKGRQAGMPVYQLIGGKCREAAQIYMHAGIADDPSIVVENAKKLVATGVRFIHVDMGFGAPVQTLGGQNGFDREAAMRHMLKIFETFRAEMPAEIGLGCDVHSKLDAQQAVQFCKAAEKFDLYFVEDPLSPEDLDYFRQIRQQCDTQIAMGELFNNPHEWQTVIQERLIDFVRCHIPHTGGFTQGRKIALFAEQFGVKTAWHAPGDMSPIAHTANLHLDLASYNFGIQEYQAYPDIVREVFQGCMEIKNGYAWANDRPGWGIELDEKAAAKFPFGSQPADKTNPSGMRPVSRLGDGTSII